MDSDIYDEKYKRPSELKYINKDSKTATMETKDIDKLDENLSLRYYQRFKTNEIYF